MNKKFLYVFAFVIVSALFTFMIQTIIDDRTKEQLKAEKELVKVTYNTITEAYRVHSNIIFFNRINTKEIKELLKDVNNLSSSEEDIVRKNLYNELFDMYENMEDFKLRQLHFHLRNNESFLRFHRTEKYGDDLSGVRDTVAFVNKYKEPIHGFEEGRIFNGYRYVYPLEYKGEYIGSVETSISMKTIIGEFRKETNAHIDFLINKSVVDSKVFKEEIKNNYFRCRTTPQFYHEKAISSIVDRRIEKVIKEYTDKKDIHKDLATGEAFNFHSPLDKKYYITTFFPIKNAVSHKTVGYIIVTKQNDEIHSFETQYYLFLSILVMLSGIIIFFIYKIDSAKEKLSRKDEVLDEVQKIGRLGYWELDLGKNQLTWSDEVYNIIGISKQDFDNSYESFLKHIHPEDIPRVTKAYQDSIRNKTNYYIEHRIITGSGEVKYVEEECHHSFDERGDVIQSLGTIHDITNLKLYQDEIIKAKKQFESLVDHIPDIIYRCELDEDFTMLYLNNAFENLTGYKDSEVILNRVISYSSLIHPEDLSFIKDEVDKVLKSDKKNLKVEYRMITKDQKVIWVRDFFEIVKDGNNKYIEGIISDITAQKESYSKLQKFIDTQDNIVILTNGKLINFANKKFFSFLEFEDLEQFKSKYDCICELFIANERFFHLGKIEESQNWVEVIQELPHSQRVVALMGKDFVVHAFSVTINHFEDNLQIVSFTDISQTMLEHIKLEEKTVHDKLTGALNREYFDQNYKQLIERYNKEHYNLAIAILDIDHFKLVNDTFGHDVGDYVLKEMVNEIQRFSRSEDLLIRWGGEEFIMVLKVESDNGLYKALEHIRTTIEKHYFEDVKKVTCSFGGTIYQEGEAIEDTIKRADNALYEAKKEGRNRVVIH